MGQYNDIEIASNFKFNQEAKVKSQLKKVSPDLRLYSLKLVGGTNKSAANDLYQDTALRIISNAAKYKYDASFKGWAKTIMRNIFIDTYRKEIQIRKMLKLSSSSPQGFQHFSLTNNNIEIKVAYDDLMKIIDALPDYLQIPFKMRLKGYKYYEIAEELNLSVGTLKSQIFDARKQLKKLYEIYFR